jgi:DNA-directed RNA polymerase sigma subunit (sigma70/sigma32)
VSRPAFVVAPSAVDPEEARLLEIIVTGRRAAAELAEEPAPDRRKGLEAAVGAADEARRLIVQAHQGLVAKIARRYQRSGVPMADLMQEGNIGLLAALDRFDPEAGRFSSFAWYWVRQMMLAAIPRHRRGRLALQAVHELLHELPPREQLVIRHRYGLGVPQRRQTDVAQTLGVTASRVCQIERDALEGLRRLAAGQRDQLLVA